MKFLKFEALKVGNYSRLYVKGYLVRHACQTLQRCFQFCLHWVTFIGEVEEAIEQQEFYYAEKNNSNLEN